MRRREFIGLLSGVVAAWPLGVPAQQPRLPLIGFLNGQSSAEWGYLLEDFRRGLQEGGFVDGQNLAIEYQWANGRNDLLDGLASDLVARKVDVLVATGGPDPVRAAKAATTTIPIVFTLGSDPVKLGVVSNLARPDGNLTGFTLFTSPLGPKRLELLCELAPTAAVVAVLVNPDNTGSEDQVRLLQVVASKVGRLLYMAFARDERSIDAAFDSFGTAKVGALFVASDAYFLARRKQIVALTARFKLPAIYEAREFAEVGGLLSYGTNFPEVYRHAGLYTARILRGATPAELPVQEPTRFDLVLNLSTAKALDISIPHSILFRADEMIE
jgi:putative ABC transport system substrate-binding protein